MIACSLRFCLVLKGPQPGRRKHTSPPLRDSACSEYQGMLMWRSNIYGEAHATTPSPVYGVSGPRRSNLERTHPCHEWFNPKPSCRYLTVQATGIPRRRLRRPCGEEGKRSGAGNAGGLCAGAPFHDAWHTALSFFFLLLACMYVAARSSSIVFCLTHPAVGPPHVLCPCVFRAGG